MKLQALIASLLVLFLFSVSTAQAQNPPKVLGPKIGNSVESTATKVEPLQTFVLFDFILKLPANGAVSSDESSFRMAHDGMQTLSVQVTKTERPGRDASKDARRLRDASIIVMNQDGYQLSSESSNLFPSGVVVTRMEFSKKDSTEVSMIVYAGADTKGRLAILTQTTAPGLFEYSLTGR